MKRTQQKQLKRALYDNLMEGITYYEMKYDSALPELYEASVENAPNIIEKIKLLIKAKRNK